MNGRNVLLVELNEITWTVIDRLIEERGPGFLPHFARLRRQAAWGAPAAAERPPHLDPWVTWVSVHTGVPREVHGATVLEQDSRTLGAKRTWEYAAEAGMRVGVFGSISAYPPPPVRGFVVPGPFAPGDETTPAALAPVQVLNRHYTRVHNKTSQSLGPLTGTRLGVAMWRLGVKPSTAAVIAQQLASERVFSHLRWRRPSLQPRLNFDIFAHLYRRYRPQFATWHTNHAAHYMHHYWRAWNDEGFLERASPLERARYGEAVPHGYRLCDELLGKFLRLIDARTVLVVASSMGQQPYVNEQFRHGRTVVRIRDIDKLLDIVGREGVVDVVPTMVPQWNLRVPDPALRAALCQRLERAERVVEGARKKAFGVSATGELITLTPRGLAGKPDDVRYEFAGCPGARPGGYALDELFATDTPTPKQGMHHPDGVLVVHGEGIAAGEIASVTNLDIAPTLLALLGLPIPEVMRESGGRVLSELWAGGRPAAAVPAAVGGGGQSTAAASTA